MWLFSNKCAPRGLPRPIHSVLCAQEAGVFAVVKDVFLPWYNAYR